MLPRGWKRTGRGTCLLRSGVHQGSARIRLEAGAQCFDSKLTTLAVWRGPWPPHFSCSCLWVVPTSNAKDMPAWPWAHCHMHSQLVESNQRRIRVCFLFVFQCWGGTQNLAEEGRCFPLSCPPAPEWTFLCHHHSTMLEQPTWKYVLCFSLVAVLDRVQFLSLWLALALGHSPRNPVWTGWRSLFPPHSTYHSPDPFPARQKCQWPELLCCASPNPTRVATATFQGARTVFIYEISTVGYWVSLLLSHVT